MTMRLDLRTQPEPLMGTKTVMLNPTPFGCADCGQWFQFAPELVAHICQAREATPMTAPDPATTAAKAHGVLTIEQQRGSYCITVRYSETDADFLWMTPELWRQLTGEATARERQRIRELAIMYRVTALVSSADHKKRRLFADLLDGDGDA